MTFPIHVLESVDNCREYTAFPWSDILGENTCHNVDRVKIEVLSNIWVLRGG